MRKTILLICAIFFATLRGQKPPIHQTPPVPAEAKSRPAAQVGKEQLWAAEKLQQRLIKEVAAKYKGEVRSEVREGPFQTLLVRAYFPGAYPGTGIMSAVVAKNALSYGIHGERDFADFVRAQGWLKNPPEPEEFMQLLDFAQFEAVVMHLSHLKEPSLEIEGVELKFRFMRGYMPNGQYAVTVTVGKTGPLRIEEKYEK